jgi:hypothetical protein
MINAVCRTMSLKWCRCTRQRYAASCRIDSCRVKDSCEVRACPDVNHQIPGRYHNEKMNSCDV